MSKKYRVTGYTRSGYTIQFVWWKPWTWFFRNRNWTKWVSFEKIIDKDFVTPESLMTMDFQGDIDDITICPVEEKQ